MTPNRRIFLNIMATYGRSLVGLMCGLVTSRWVLAAIGAEGYGVYGVIGVIIGICAIINATISGSVGRYYAYAYGKSLAAKDKAAALDECRNWFNVAVLLHLIFPLIFTIFGFFVGEWCIEHYFRIPPHYLATSHWVLYFALTSMFFGMFTGPFRAMYVAQQRIAELTMYEIFAPLFTLLFAWILLSYSGDRLFFHAGYSMMIAVVPNLIIIFRALVVFPECKIVFAKMKNFNAMRQLFSFAGWQFIGLTGLTLKTQGMPTLVNRCLGIQFNSTISIAGTVVNHVGSLSSSLNNAFSPAVTNAAGAEDIVKFRNLALRTSKFSTILLMLFALPLVGEMEYVIGLWLQTPPPSLASICILLLLDAIIERSATGSMIAINALGNIKLHECLCFIFHLLTLVLCYCFAVSCGMGILGVGVGLVSGTGIIAVMRMTLWRFQLKMPLRWWMFKFVLPVTVVAIFSYYGGWGIRMLMQPGFLRLIISSVVTFIIFLIGVYVIALDSDERGVVKGWVDRYLKRGAH